MILSGVVAGEKKEYTIPCSKFNVYRDGDTSESFITSYTSAYTLEQLKALLSGNFTMKILGTIPQSLSLNNLNLTGNDFKNRRKYLQNFTPI